MAKARTIKETAQVEIDHDDAVRRYPNFDRDVWEPWTWRIARGPDWAFSVPGFPNHHMCKTHPALGQFGVPETTFLYEIEDADTVLITGLIVV